MLTNKFHFCFLSQKLLQQVEYLLAIALQDDERGKATDASKMYSCAIELAIQAVSNSSTTLLIIVTVCRNFHTFISYPHMTKCLLIVAYWR